MEANLQRRVGGLKGKMPDIEKTLETVRFLQLRRGTEAPLETTFELNDTLYARAEVPPTDEVFLWLGANVMLSYPIDDAEALLGDKLLAAQTSLGNCEEDLEYLREQITVRRRQPTPTPFRPSRRRAVAGELVLTVDAGGRPWRLPLPGCTTGTWCRSGKKRPRRRQRAARRAKGHQTGNAWP